MKALLMLQGQCDCRVNDSCASPWRRQKPVIDSVMRFHCYAFVALQLFTTAMEINMSAKPLGSSLVHQRMNGKTTATHNRFCFVRETIFGLCLNFIWWFILVILSFFLWPLEKLHPSVVLVLCQSEHQEENGHGRTVKDFVLPQRVLPHLPSLWLQRHFSTGHVFLWHL